MKRRFLRLLAGALAAGVLAPFAAPASAEQYPARSIRLIVTFPPGGAVDTVGRVLARGLSERFGVNVYVDNKGGASGLIGVQEAIRAQPDGYTLMMASSDTLTVLPLLRSVPFDPERDLAPIGKVSDVYFIFAANPKLPAASIQELVELAKRKPGELRFSSAGTGTTLHMSFEYFRHLAGVDIRHIPYNGGAPATLAAVGGHVELVSTGVNIFKTVLGGKLRGLAVSKATRSVLLPDVPTLIENGYPDFNYSSWFGVFAPAKLPEALAEQLSGEVVALASGAEFKRQVLAVGAEAHPLTRQQLRKHMAEESERWRKIVAATGVKLAE